MGGVERTAGGEHVVDQQQLPIRDLDTGDQANMGSSLPPLEGAALLLSLIHISIDVTNSSSH